MSTNPLLEKCLQRIAEEAGWGESSQWTHQRFSELSERILRKTGILISISSLKRLYGKTPSRHEPQIGTKNALASFLGYKDWEEYIENNSLPVNEGHVKKNFPHKVRRRFVYITFLLLIFVAGIFFIQRHIEKRNLEKISFSGNYLTGTSPGTVIINYDITGVKDSIFIDWDDDFTTTSKELLDPGRNIISHHYVLPDLYKLTLVHKNKVIRKLNVNLETTGWRAYLEYNNQTRYFPFDYERGTGNLEVDPEKAFNSGLFRKDEKVMVKYRLVKDFGISGDNCRFNARVAELKKVKSLDCFAVSFVLHGDSGKINLTFVQKDCIHKAFIRFGEKVLDGRYNDLSALSTDFTLWKNLEILIENQNLIVSIQDETRITLPFPLTMGNIRVILYDAPLSGALDFIQLTDTQSGITYFEGFQ
jgi:hypothetical protein